MEKVTKNFDVCVIGAGVVGCAVARELSKYELKIAVLEREEDVCSGTSKANSAIAHAGYDALPGTMKAKMNIRGADLIRELSKELDFEYSENGSLVLCFDESDLPALKELYARGVKNGVKGLEIISGDEARKLEPALSENAVAALYAPTAGTLCPFGMTFAFAENAAANGVSFEFLTEVQGIEKTGGGFAIRTDRGGFSAKYVVNAAGVYADSFHNMVSDEKIEITPRRGEYVLLDKEAGNTVSRTIFQLPSKYGKGVLITPTVHGNLLIGPSAEDIDDKENTATTAEGTALVKERALASVPGLAFGKMITGFTGLRAHEKGEDFIVGEAADAPGFFDAAGIESPGLTGAPAIGEYIAGLIGKKSGARLKENFIRTRKGIPQAAKLPPAERAALIASDPAYGRIVCRCESISEGEIRQAVRRVPGAVSLDGVKRRVRAGMGRCQAGFCTPLTMQILAEELGADIRDIRKNRPGSEIIKG